MTQSPDGVYGCGSEGAADVLKRALSRRGIPTAHRWTSCETSASRSRPCGVSNNPGRPSRTPCWHTKVLCRRSGVYAFTHPTCRAHLEWASWKRSSPASSSSPMVVEEPQRVLGESTSRAAAAGTPLTSVTVTVIGVFPLLLRHAS